MIHVAPCSCELHVRIRELEAELEQKWHDGYAAGSLYKADLRARAEKAEARVAELYHHARDEHGCLHVIESKGED